MDYVDFWTKLAGIATTLEAVVVTVGAIYAAIQWRESVRSRNLTVTVQMLEILGDEEIKQAIRLLRELPQEPEKLSDQDWNLVAKVSHRFSRVGLLVLHKMLEEEIVLDMYSGMIISTWERLRPYILFRRAQDDPSRWQCHFEQLAACSYKYRQEHSS